METLIILIVLVIVLSAVAFYLRQQRDVLRKQLAGVQMRFERLEQDREELGDKLQAMTPQWVFNPHPHHRADRKYLRVGTPQGVALFTDSAIAEAVERHKRLFEE